MRIPSLLLALTLVTQFLRAQSADKFSDHVIWERNFPGYRVSILNSSTVDPAGNLWAISTKQRSSRLICIRSDGEMTIDTALPKELEPTAPSDMSDFSLATSSTGVVVLLVRYSHANGRTIYADGAVLATVHIDGTLSPARKVAGSGPEYSELTSLSDGHFLLIGDQSPLVVIHLTADGIVDWRKTFPASWDLSSAAGLERGSACVASPVYARNLLHMIWLDEKGIVRHNEQLLARAAGTAAINGSCAVLYNSAPRLPHNEFYLTAFSQAFGREWTTRVYDNPAWGGGYGLVATRSGYALTLGLAAGVFLARYSPTGQPKWSITDTSRQHATAIIATGDDFYLIGADAQDHYGLHVARMH